MIKAYPIDGKGQNVGPVKSFPNDSWERMVKSFGKKLRWVEEKSESKTDTGKKTTAKSEKKAKATNK